MKPEYDSKSTDDPELVKELTLQVRKVIGPFAAPKKIVSRVSAHCDTSSSTLPSSVPFISMIGPILSCLLPWSSADP